MVPQGSQQYAPFSRLLPQPTLPMPNSMQQQQHHHPQQPQQLSTLQPSPLTQQAPFGSSTSYTHHTTPSMYHYATTSPTDYSQSPGAYSSSSMAPSYIQILPGAASYTQTIPGTTYDQTQSQSTIHGQSYTVPQSVDATKYEKVSPQETPSTMYGYGWGQGQSEGQGVKQARQGTQEQGSARS